MLRKCDCRNCVHCVYEDKMDYNIYCTKFGETSIKARCAKYKTEKEYLKEKMNNGRK